MESISIIGCGWLGLPLGVFLNEKGYRVKGSTTREEKLSVLKEEGIEPFLLKVGESIKGENIEPLFQSEILILNIPPRRKTPDIEAYYPQQIRAIYQAAKEGNIRNLLFISSTGVYGNVNRVVTEEDVPQPERTSGKALLHSESFLTAQKTLKLTILRFSGLVGGDRRAGRFLAGKKDLSNAKAPINLIHRDDCIQIIYQIIRQNKWGFTLNASADHHPEKAIFYQAQATKMGLEPPTFRADGQSDYKIISNKKLKRELNYQFHYPDPMKF